MHVGVRAHVRLMICVCYKLCCKVNETWEWGRKTTLRFDIYTNTHTHTFTHRFIGRCFDMRSEEPRQIYFLCSWIFISERFQLFLPLFFLTFHLFCCSFVCLFDSSLPVSLPAVSTPPSILPSAYHSFNLPSGMFARCDSTAQRDRRCLSHTVTSLSSLCCLTVISYHTKWRHTHYWKCTHAQWQCAHMVNVETHTQRKMPCACVYA